MNVKDVIFLVVMGFIFGMMIMHAMVNRSFDLNLEDDYSRNNTATPHVHAGVFFMLIFIVALLYSNKTFAMPMEEHNYTCEIAMCTDQELVRVAPNEVRVYSHMVTEDGAVHEFWNYVAYNNCRVGITYNLWFDENNNFIDIAETEW